MLPYPLTRRLRLESLEHRLNPTSTLFVDFGDNFPAAGLTGTIGELKTATSGVPGDPQVQGPDMDGSTNGDWDVGNDNDNTNDMDNADTFDLVSFVDRYTVDGGNYPGGLAQLRADIMTMLRRFYEPFDIDVIELTSTPIDVNGRMVASATSLADVSSTLGANETTAKNNDSYVMLGAMVVHRPAVAGGDFDPATIFGGYASVIDMPNSNNNDNSAVCYLDPGDLAGATNAGFWAYLIAHEAGHNFGFQHSLTQAPGPNVSPLIPQSEIMSYLTGSGFNFFSRYPIVRGNANTNNNDDLMAVAPPAPAANRTPYDQWINTPSIGQNNAFHYITGTGAHDIITITLTGANQATVAVQAFSDAAYTNALTVPGSAGASTTYTYNLALDRPFVIDGGALNDRVVLDGDLGITLTVRGMDGTDEVVVMGKNAATATYTPTTSTANGLDGNADLRGGVAIGTTTINFQELEAASRLLIQDVTTVNFAGSAGSDAISFDQAAGNVRTTGTVNSGTVFVPLELANVGTYNANGNAANDTFTLLSGYASPGGFTLNIVGGTETDTLVGGNVARTFTITGVNAGTVNTTQPANFSSVENLEGGTASDSFVFNGGSLSGTINGGGSADTITGDNNPRTFNITGANAGNISGLLASGFISVENLVGGTAGDSFVFASGGVLTGTIDGAGGTDTLTGDDNARTFTITGANAGNVSTVLINGFTNIENLAGGSQNDAFNFNAGGSLTGTINGGGGTDTITGDNTARTFTITGADAGTISTLLPAGFTNVENLTGGTAGDAFVFNAGGSLTGTIDGGDGSDTITGDNTARTYNITGANAGNIPTLLPVGFTNVENLVGGTAGDTFAFDGAGSLTGTINGGDGGDLLDGNDAPHTYTINGANAGTVSELLPAGFTNIESLVGGTGVDQFTFVAGGSLTGTINGDAGNDTLTGDDNARTFTITGANAGNVSTILANGFTNIENLVGGAVDDAFNFNAGGSLTGTINGGAGTDTITGDNTARTFTITLPNAGNVLVLLPAGFTNVENLAGGTAGDTFTFNNGGSLTGTIDGNGGNDIINGDDGGRTFTLTALNQGTISDILPAGFSDVETLNGGIGADSLVVANNNGAIAGFFDGKGNIDTVDLSLKTVAQSIVVQTSSVNGFNTTGGTAATGGFRDIDRLFGSGTATTDRLTGRPEHSQWIVRAGADQSFYRLAGSGRTLFFNRFEVLVGSTSTDYFTVNFNAGNPLTAAGLTVAGMGGTDTLRAIGTANGDNFKLLSQQLHVNGNVIRFTSMEYVDSYGGAGNDYFHSPGTAVLSSLKLIRFYGEDGNDLALIDPKTTTPYYLHGGNGTDKLIINRGTARFKTPLPSRSATSGTYYFTNRQLIQFVSFETKDIGVLQPQP